MAKPEEWRDLLILGDAKLQDLPIAKAILAVEDVRFYERDLVIDLRAIARAIIEDIKEGKIVEGGSTIPQQLVKQLLPEKERSEKSVLRKIKELVLASRLVTRLNKDHIFLLYLDEIYTGHQRKGVDAASLFYFNKHAKDISWSEAATIAGLIQSPERLSPKKHPVASKARRDLSLKKIWDAGMISLEEYEATRKEELLTTDDFSKACQRAPHAVDYVKEILDSEHEIKFNEAYDNQAWYGIRVETTLDLEIQRLGTDGVKLALEVYKEKYRENAIDAEGAFLGVENGTGAILAMVGGNDYSRRKFNHVKGKRQPGSAFKPDIYAAKFEQELAEGKPYDTLLDRTVSNAAIVCKDKKDPKTGQWTYWVPRNFDEKKFSAGFYPRRFAIAQSINRPAVHTAQVGNCVLDPRVLIMAKKLGIESTIDPYLPSSLGASGVSLIELVRMYSVFSNKGVLRPLYVITKISDSFGMKFYEKISWETKKDCGEFNVWNKQTRKWEKINLTCGISEVLAGLMVEALRGVVKFGTARSLDALTQPSAGKTGTTENYIDAWFIGFTPHITYGAWVGGPEDYTKPLGDKATGGSTALPIVKYVLENWYRDSQPVEFLEISEEYMKSLVQPKDFQTEMESLKNSDPDVEAPQE